jgi:hypothetical protein
MSKSTRRRNVLKADDQIISAEVVLAMLIEKFAFAIPPNRDIVWCATNIQTPSLRGMERETPRMPMLVSLA